MGPNSVLLKSDDINTATRHLQPKTKPPTICGGALLFQMNYKQWCTVKDSTKLVIKVTVASEKENKDKLRRNLWEVAACELSKAGHRTLVATMGKKATILNGELELELS